MTDVIDLKTRATDRNRTAPKSGETETYQQVLLAIDRARREGGVALITGAGGTGKTMAALAVIEALGANGHATFYIPMRTALANLRQGLCFLLDELDIFVDNKRQAPEYELQRALEDADFASDTVIVIDEAQQASNELLAVLRDFIDQRQR